MMVRIILALVVLAVSVSSITACTQKGQYLIEILKILPDEVVVVGCADIKAMKDDPDLEANLNSIQNRMIREAEGITGVDVSSCVYTAEVQAVTGYLIILIGEFNVREVRDSLTEKNYGRDTYEGMEIWIKDSLAVTSLKPMLVIGEAETVKASIRVNKNKEPSLYDNEDVKEVADKLLSGVISMVFAPGYMSNMIEILAGGICLQNQQHDDRVLDIQGWYKFHRETSAEAAFKDIEDYFKFIIESSGEFNVMKINCRPSDGFVEITGRVEIPAN